jgi:TatD DNase family protein
MTSSHASHAYLPAPSFPLHIPRIKAEKWKEGSGVKGRMEPADVAVIAEVVAGVKGADVGEVIRAAWENAGRLFWGDGRIE